MGGGGGVLTVLMKSKSLQVSLRRCFFEPFYYYRISTYVDRLRFVDCSGNSHIAVDQQ